MRKFITDVQPNEIDDVLLEQLKKFVSFIDPITGNITTVEADDNISTEFDEEIRIEKNKEDEANRI